MLDAGIDVIGYAAFVQSRYREYAGIHKNLDALHEYLLNTPEPDIINYDLQAFLVTSARGARGHARIGRRNGCAGAPADRGANF